MFPSPVYLRVVADLKQELRELFREKRVVILKIEPEEWIGLNERAAPHNNLGSSLGDRMKGGKLLKDPHRILGAEDSNGAG